MKKNTNNDFEIIYKIPEEEFDNEKEHLYEASCFLSIILSLISLIVFICIFWTKIIIIPIIFCVLIILIILNAILLKNEKLYFSWIRKKRLKFIKKMQNEIYDIFSKKTDEIFLERENLKKLVKAMNKHSVYEKRSELLKEKIKKIDYLEKKYGR